MHLFFRRCIFPVLGMLLACGAWAQAPFVAAPAQAQAPLRLIVPFTPGTGIDLIARTVGPRLGERLGRPVVVHLFGADGRPVCEVPRRARPAGDRIHAAPRDSRQTIDALPFLP